MVLNWIFAFITYSIRFESHAEIKCRANFQVTIHILYMSYDTAASGRCSHHVFTITLKATNESVYCAHNTKIHFSIVVIDHKFQQNFQFSFTHTHAHEHLRSSINWLHFGMSNLNAMRIQFWFFVINYIYLSLLTLRTIKIDWNRHISYNWKTTKSSAAHTFQVYAEIKTI